MEQTVLAYLAGAMDSDGYFTIRRNTYGVRVIKDCAYPTYSERVGIKQTSPEIIDLIKDSFGGSMATQKPNTPNGKPLHSVQLTNKKAVAFIEAILPYLRIKKRQAEILLELRKSKEEKRGVKKKTLQKDRWGQLNEFTRYVTSEEQIEFRENLLKEVRSLNDARSSEVFTPIPWR